MDLTEGRSEFLVTVMPVFNIRIAHAGGPFFNLLNFGKRGDLKEYQTKEIKNGRLAM